MFWKKKNNSKTNPDFEEFKKEISWFVKPTDKVILEDSINTAKLSETLKHVFPKLHRLISVSRIQPIKINGKDYILYSWTNGENKSCGWLIEIELKRNNELQMCLEHELLLEEIGGIRESYNQPEPSLCNNQNFMFIGSECGKGIGEYQEYYDMMCKECGCEKINDEYLISFVQEANGALTLYDQNSQEVYLFSHDHCFDNVDFLEQQPKYTYHRINGINTFVDYVETLAEEWLNEIRE